jgi:hypothetical protein
LEAYLTSKSHFLKYQNVPWKSPVGWTSTCMAPRFSFSCQIGLCRYIDLTVNELNVVKFQTKTSACIDSCTSTSLRMRCNHLFACCLL